MKKDGIGEGDRVAVGEDAILAQLAPDAGPKARNRALCDKYYVTGVGPTRYGIRNADNSMRFNVPHEKVFAL